jgi:hypothetical protein
VERGSEAFIVVEFRTCPKVCEKVQNVCSIAEKIDSNSKILKNASFSTFSTILYEN